MLSRTVFPPLALVALTLSSCTGVIVDPKSDDDGRRPNDPLGGPSGNAVPIDCRGPAVPAASPLRRFAVDEYVEALRGVLGETVVADLSGPLSTLPPDEPVEEDGFSRHDDRVSERHVDTYYAVADAAARRVAGDAVVRAELVGDCAAAGIDAACLRTFVPSFLREAYRRPATDAEIDAAMALAAEHGGIDGLHAVVFTTLMSPDFVYRFENRGTVDGDVVRLTPFEVASRLSFHFWGTPPDDELLRAAEAGELETEVGYAAQVDRLYEDPRTDETIMTFFTEWLHLGRGEYGDNPRLEVLRDGIEVDGLGAEMTAEVRDLLRFHLERQDGWMDVLTSPLSFARSDRLASIYGVPAWDGSSEPPTLPASERSGLLTRAGMLFTTDGSTNPFRRGIFVRRTILCDSVPAPPDTLPADALQPPDLEAGASTRDAYAAKVVGEPCASCHANFSPLGYTFEAYDGLGRFRTEEHVVSATGEDFGRVPVDATAIAAVELDDSRPVSGPVELTQRIAESDKPDECFARHYFRFTHRRAETASDACTVGSLAAHLADGASMHEALRAIALEPAFRQRQLVD